MVKIHIDVTAEDIRLGKACDSQYCPVARAVQRQLGKLWRVGSSSISKLAEDETVVRPALMLIPPSSVSYFVTAFDLHLSVDPFSFELEIPDEGSEADEAPLEKLPVSSAIVDIERSTMK